MVVVVITARILPAKAEEYERELRDLIPKMKAMEPGMFVYEVGRSREEPNIYRHIELYRDDKAMDEHRANEFVNARRAAMFACVDGGYAGYDVKFHDTF
jgi:quinol monooxygenase YgiN